MFSTAIFEDTVNRHKACESMYKEVQSTWKARAKHMQKHVQGMWRACTWHLQDMCKACVKHVKACAKHVKSICKACAKDYFPSLQIIQN